MKTLLTTLCLVFIINAHAQNSLDSVYILALQHDTVYSGDTTWVGITGDGGLSTATQHDTTKIYIKQNADSFQIFKKNAWSLFEMHYNYYCPQCQTSIDSLHLIKYRVPLTWSGWYKIKGQIFKYGGISDSVFVINNNSGIKQNYSSSALISTEYFNLLGQPIKEPDGVTVEIKTYQSGKKEVRKIITP